MISSCGKDRGRRQILGKEKQETHITMKLLVFLLALAVVDARSHYAKKANDDEQPGQLDDVECLYWTNCTEGCGGGRKECPRSDGKQYKIDCHLQSCEEVEDCGKADIVYVLDDSTSIGEKNYWVTKQFTIDIIKGLNVSPEFTRVALVTYGTRAITRWKFGDYDDEFQLEDAIWGLEKVGGNTNTAEALEHAQEIIESTSRASVKHIVVIITDGESNMKPHNTIPQAEEMHEQGIEIFAIGIGNVNEDELRGIASPLKDEHWHHVPDYTALTHITNSVINETCTATSTKLRECDPWSEWTPCTVRDGGCGKGNKTRSRECRFYNYEGADPIIRIDIQHLECIIDCPKTTPSPPVTCVNWTECNAKCDGVGFRRCYRSNGHIWKIPCCGEPCDDVLCDKADVVFILDSSISIGEKHWCSARQFAADVVQGLPLGEEDIWVGAVTFSRRATTEFTLGVYNTQESLTREILALPWSAGVTNSQDGLKHAKQIFDDKGREGIPKIAIFLSDGESNVRPHRTIPAAQQLHADGVKVFAVAVRKSGIEELKGIASDPVDRFYHQIDSFEDLVDIVKTIIDETCEEARR